MTDHEIALAKALAACSYLPGSPDKRFAHTMAAAATNTPGIALSVKQQAYLQRMAWRYRRQLPAALVPVAKPEGER